MYAQLIEIGTTPERIDELGSVVGRDLVNALRSEPGFSGALTLVQRAAGRLLLLILWETGDEAERPLVDCGAPLLDALSTVAQFAASDPGPATVWEVYARA